MPVLVQSLMFATLVAIIPFSMLLRVLLQLPRPIASSYRRWPLSFNLTLIAAIATCVFIFIRNTYFSGHPEPAVIALRFLIVAVVYAFAIVLLVRQFCGVYPEFIVTISFMGLGLRKTTYRNIANVEKVSERGGETLFRVDTKRGVPLSFTLPRRYVSLFYDHIQKKAREFEGLDKP